RPAREALARARRRARRRRAPRGRLPPRASAQLARRDDRRSDVLRAVRLSHHDAVAARVRLDRNRAVQLVLRPPRASPASRARGVRARGRAVLRGDGTEWADDRLGTGRRALRRELGACGARVRHVGSLRAHVVAVGRGAVLPGLAGRRRPRWRARTPTAARERGARRLPRRHRGVVRLAARAVERRRSGRVGGAPLQRDRHGRGPTTDRLRARRRPRRRCGARPGANRALVRAARPRRHRVPAVDRDVPPGRCVGCEQPPLPHLGADGVRARRRGGGRRLRARAELAGAAGPRHPPARGDRPCLLRAVLVALPGLGGRGRTTDPCERTGPMVVRGRCGRGADRGIVVRRRTAMPRVQAKVRARALAATSRDRRLAGHGRLMGRPVRIPRVVTRAVARVKPRVPRSAWPLLLTLRSMAGNGPLVGLPRCRRALVLAAHPDDESLGCAGTIALLADTGTTVSLLVATDGEATRGSSLPPAQTAARRRAEGERSAALLGASARFLGMPDGCLTERRAELANAIARCIAELRPDIVFLPWFLDGHPDHRAVSDAFVTTVVGLAPGIEAWGYETWTPLPPNRLVDITAVVDRKRASLA